MRLHGVRNVLVFKTPPRGSRDCNGIRRVEGAASGGRCPAEGPDGVVSYRHNPMNQRRRIDCRLYIPVGHSPSQHQIYFGKNTPRVNRVETFATYCEVHKCTYCYAEALSPNTRKSGGYCVTHTCRVPSCSNGTIIADAQFCRTHTCIVIGLKIRKTRPWDLVLWPFAVL